jgi:hypothetical protein
MLPDTPRLRTVLTRLSTAKGRSCELTVSVKNLQTNNLCGSRHVAALNS